MSEVALPRNAVMPRPAGSPPAVWQPPEIPLILDAPKPRTRVPMLLGYAVVLLFIVGLGSWAAFTPLAEAAIAPGVLKVEGTRRTIVWLSSATRRASKRADCPATASCARRALEDVSSRGNAIWGVPASSATNRASCASRAQRWLRTVSVC